MTCANIGDDWTYSSGDMLADRYTESVTDKHKQQAASTSCNLQVAQSGHQHFKE